MEVDGVSRHHDAGTVVGPNASSYGTLSDESVGLLCEPAMVIDAVVRAHLLMDSPNVLVCMKAFA